MADGFVVGERTALANQRACFRVDRAELPAVGTRGRGGQGLGLLLQEGGEGTLGQSPGSGGGNLFQGGQVRIEAGAGFAEGTTGHNFTPLGGQVTDILEFFGSQFGSGHRLSCLAVTSKDKVDLSFLFYRKEFRPAKPVLASPVIWYHPCFWREGDRLGIVRDGVYRLVATARGEMRKNG
jgi:hypothetical protein